MTWYILAHMPYFRRLDHKWSKIAERITQKIFLFSVLAKIVLEIAEIENWSWKLN